MINRILNASNQDDLTLICIDILANNGIRQFYEAFTASKLVLRYDDKWPREFFDTVREEGMSITDLLHRTTDEPTNVKLLHRIQLMQFYCPACQEMLRHFIGKTCV